MITIRDVSFTYAGNETDGIHHINLEIQKGECVLLCGRSGCGKTTVTRLINGLIPSLKCNSRTKYQFWRLLHSCAERVHIIRKFAQSKLDVFFSGAICTAENKRSFTKSLNRMVGNLLLHILKVPF